MTTQTPVRHQPPRRADSPPPEPPAEARNATLCDAALATELQRLQQEGQADRDRRAELARLGEPARCD